ncbi:MAG: hypothetical protein V4574_09160 [Pseudomonadota bacterium]
MSVGTDLLAAPFPQMVRSLGTGIAEAQLELDLVSLKIARMMAGYAVDEEDDEEDENGEDGGENKRKYLVEFSDGQKYSLLELGFTPTFYQFVDTVIELKLSISMKSETAMERKTSTTQVTAGGFAFPFVAGGSVRATSVSASFSSKYQYSAEGSSMMRTKLVPIPPPALLEERIRALIAAKTTPTP